MPWTDRQFEMRMTARARWLDGFTLISSRSKGGILWGVERRWLYT